MIRINSNSLALAIIYFCCISAKELTDIEALASQPTRCSYEYAFDMYGAHCVGLRLSKIPSLSGSIEILDFSDNRLREIEANTLSYYSNIKFLYLADNQVYLLNEQAFSSLPYLETLDLSRNVITDLPTSIFQLQALRKLYLSGNPLIHVGSSYFEGVKPIKAPLELLDLSDCKIRVLPDFGILPQLKSYNLSNNPLTKLEVNHFAGMCNLDKLDLTAAIDGIQLCQMSTAIWWLQDRHIYFQLLDYSKLNSQEFKRCPRNDPQQSEIHNSTYEACKSEIFEVPHVPRTIKRTWLTVSGGLAGFLIGFILLLYFVHRINVANSKSREAVKVKSPGDTDKQITAVLLNNS